MTEVCTYLVISSLRITNQEAKYKLCRVREVKTGPKNVPYLYTSDDRTIHYPDPIVKADDSINKRAVIIVIS